MLFILSLDVISLSNEQKCIYNFTPLELEKKYLASDSPVYES